MVVFFFKQKTAYEMRISDWSSDVCSSDLIVMTLERLDRHARGDLAVQRHLDDVVRRDRPHRGRALAQRHDIFARRRRRLRRFGNLEHLERARAVGKAAEKPSFFQRADQPVNARFRLEAERLLHLLERRRNAARVEALLDEVEQFMLLRGQHRSFSMMTRRRSEEHTSELQSLMRISYAVFCLLKHIPYLFTRTFTYII